MLARPFVFKDNLCVKRGLQIIIDSQIVRLFLHLERIHKSRLCVISVLFWTILPRKHQVMLLRWLAKTCLVALNKSVRNCAFWNFSQIENASFLIVHVLRLLMRQIIFVYFSYVSTLPQKLLSKIIFVTFLIMVHLRYRIQIHLLSNESHWFSDPLLPLFFKKFPLFLLLWAFLFANFVLWKRLVLEFAVHLIQTIYSELNFICLRLVSVQI